MAQDQPAQAPHNAPPSAATKPIPARDGEADNAPDARRAQTVARFQGGVIRVADIEDDLDQRGAFIAQHHQDEKHLHDYLTRRIEFELLAKEAERKGYAKHEAVERAVKQSAVQALMRERFDRSITQESIPEADIKAYYDVHQDDYHRPEMRRASHLVVESRSAAEALIEQARQADVRAFAKLARDH
ncbi:MAG: peptidyl-prolyl cis-trans isomerase, partial [Polyangiales bacterium]